MDQPLRLVFAAIIFLLGERIGFLFPRFAGVWPVMAGLGGFVVLLLKGWGRRCGWFPILFGIGMILAARTDCLRERIVGEERAFGRAVTEEFGVDDTVEIKPLCPAKGSLERVSFLSHRGPVAVKVMLSLPGGGTMPQVGERWRCTGRYGQVAKETERFSRRTFWVSVGSARCVAVAPIWSFRKWCACMAEDWSERVSRGLAWCPDTAGLLRAMLLGRRTDMSREKREMFVAAGTIHVFAISGLHVMVVAWVLSSLVAGFGVSHRMRPFLVIPLVWGYVAVTGMRPSAIRAAVMMALTILGPVFNREPNLLTAWAVTAFGVYAVSPERLFDAGCSLSFGVMLGIALWLRYRPPSSRPSLKSWLGQEEPWWTRKGREIGEGMGVTAAAWMAGTPLVAHCFGRLSLGGLVANLPVLVLAKIAVTFGVCGLMASFVLPPLAGLFNCGAAVSVDVMMLISACVASLPGTSFEVVKWGGLVCCLWYGAALGALWLSHSFRQLRLTALGW